MKEHILSRGSEFIPHISSLETHYDFESQVNYLEENFENKAVFNKTCKDKTKLTETVEQSDRDQVVGFTPAYFNSQKLYTTKATFTVENTDKDH